MLFITPSFLAGFRWSHFLVGTVPYTGRQVQDAYILTTKKFKLLGQVAYILLPLLTYWLFRNDIRTVPMSGCFLRTIIVLRLFLTNDIIFQDLILSIGLTPQTQNFFSLRYIYWLIAVRSVKSSLNSVQTFGPFNSKCLTLDGLRVQSLDNLQA